MGNFSLDVYSADNDQQGPHGWIAWKGTDVCIDLHCICGHHGHFDGEYLYFYECPSCHAKYAVGQVVTLIPLTDEQARHVDDQRGGFKTTCF